jgi:hypothetical protein
MNLVAKAALGPDAHAVADESSTRTGSTFGSWMATLFRFRVAPGGQARPWSG